MPKQAGTTLGEAAHERAERVDGRPPPTTEPTTFPRAAGQRRGSPTASEEQPSAPAGRDKQRLTRVNISRTSEKADFARSARGTLRKRRRANSIISAFAAQAQPVRQASTLANALSLHSPSSFFRSHHPSPADHHARGAETQRRPSTAIAGQRGGGSTGHGRVRTRAHGPQRGSRSGGREATHASRASEHVQYVRWDERGHARKP